MFEKFEDAFEEAIVNEFFVKDSKRIKKESIDSYLNSFELNQLRGAAVISYLFETEELDLDIKKSKKEYYIKCIKDNIDSYISNLVVLVDLDLLGLLEEIANNKDVTILDKPIGYCELIGFLKNMCFISTEYDKEKERLKIYMPDEFKEEICKCLNDEELLDLNSDYTSIYEISNVILSAYGIIEIDKLHEIFEMYIDKIDIEEFANILFLKCLYKGNNLFDYKDKQLFCNIEFSNKEEAFKFYKEQEGNYRIYGIDEYAMIDEGCYITNLKSYDKIVDFFLKKYEITEEEFIYLNEMILVDYLFTAQLSVERADENFKSNVKDMFNITDNDLNRALTLMKNVFKDYPKWKKRGNK